MCPYNVPYNVCVMCMMCLNNLLKYEIIFELQIIKFFGLLWQFRNEWEEIKYGSCYD